MENELITTEQAKAYLEKEGLNVEQLVKEGFDFIEDVKKRIALQKRWIPIEQLDLKDYEDVLVLLENGEFFKAMYCDDVDFNFTSEYFNKNKGIKITHYMPIVLPSM